MFGIKTLVNVSLVLASLLATASFAVPVTMVCVAKHPDSEQLFTGEGLRWTGARRAVDLCKEFALNNGLDATACKIESCEPADLSDLTK